MSICVLTFFQEIRTAAIRTLTALVHMECSPRYFEHSSLKHIKKFLKKSVRVMEICSICSICVRKSLNSLMGYIS